MNNKRSRRNRSAPPAVIPQVSTQAPAGNGQVTTVARTTTAQWSGPLPPPAALEHFDRIAPGSAQVIIDEFTKEAAHRRRQEDRDQRFQIRHGHIGQALAALFASGCLVLAGFAIVNGHPVAGTVIGSGVIVAGITAFLSRPQGNEKAKK